VTTEQIEQQAEEVLAGVPDWLWNGETLPVPVDDIVDTCFGLLVREVEDMSAAPGAPSEDPDHPISGLLLTSRGEIWVNADEARQWPPRRRFTIGHELGHWCMHLQPSGQSLFCRHASINSNDGDSLGVERSIEDEANGFAAALTMPAHLMRMQYERLSGEPDCHERMCRFFGSSRAAMGKRMHTVL
jgi:IrrE N-terminal-like domain